MRIAQQQGLKITEATSDDFLVHATLNGSYTIDSMRQFGKIVLPYVADDIRRGAYKVLSISPDQCFAREQDSERLWQESVMAACVHGGRSFLADSRDIAGYYGSLWHTHPNAITTALASESGSLSTFFIRDDEEFLQCLSDAGALRFLAEHNPETNSAHLNSVGAANSLLRIWDSASQLRSQLRAMTNSTKSTLQARVAKITPRVGKITFFGDQTIHASGIVVPDSVPGSLFVSQSNMSSFQE